MRSIRLIPCLDIKDGRVVKGTNFVDLQDSGDPVELASRYSAGGADELVFLDITASSDDRPTVIDLAERVAREIFIPFTVGGGLRTPEAVREALLAGADKVSLNSAAVQNPGLISACAERFGAQCVVLAVDARQRADGSGWDVFTHGGRRPTGIDVIDWIREGAARGAGEVLLTSMDRDGTWNGFDIELLRTASLAVDIPIIASGGAGQPDHLVEAVKSGLADAVLVAGILHRQVYTILELKQAMAESGLVVRIPRELREAASTPPTK